MKKPLRIALPYLLCLGAVILIGRPNAVWSMPQAADAPAVAAPAAGAPAAGAPAAGAPAAVADAYVSDTVPEQFNLAGLDPKADRNKFAEVRRVRGEFETKVTAALGNTNALSGADQDLVRNWVGQVLLAEMTTLDLDTQTKFGEMRQDFFRKIVRPATDSNRTFLINNVILPKVVDVSGKNYHPAARINATIILGLLDAQEGVSGQRPPKPHMGALGELLKIVDNPQSPEYLVAAAIGGLQRHAEIDGQLPERDRMRTDVRTMIVDSMLKQIAKYEADQSEDKPGYLLSRRAVQTLDGLNLPGNDPKVAEVKTVLTKVATKKEAGKWLRLDAFLALAQLPLDDPKAYLDNLGQLVVYVTKDSRNRVLLAQKMVKIEQMIKEKTGQAQAKKKTTGARRGPKGVSGGDQAQSLGEEDQGPAQGMGGGMGGMAGLDDFTEDGLFPYHLHYARTDVKVVVAATRSILGASGRTPTGLKAAFASNAAIVKQIDLLEKELKALLAVTDIGFVEEKPMTAAEQRMKPAEAALREQPNSVRVLAGMGQLAEALEKIVGQVELPNAELEPTTPETVKVSADRSTAERPAPATETKPGTEESATTESTTEGNADEGATTGATTEESNGGAGGTENNSQEGGGR